MTLAGLATSIGRDMGEAYFAYLAAEHPENSSLDRLTRAWFDLFRASALRVAATASDHGAGGWVYNFEVETDHPLGVTHFADIPFAFDWLQDAYPLALIHEATDTNKAIAKAWSHTLIAFAKSGEPNGAGLPQWPNYKPNEFECLRIRRNPDVVSNPDGNMLSVYKVI